MIKGHQKSFIKKRIYLSVGVDALVWQFLQRWTRCHWTRSHVDDDYDDSDEGDGDDDTFRLVTEFAVLSCVQKVQMKNKQTSFM